MTKKPRKKAVSDQEIVAALLQCGTVREAAVIVGLRPRTIYDRMKRDDFRQEYEEAQEGLLRAAVHKMSKRLSRAVDVAGAIMENQRNKPLERLKAASLILEYAARYFDLMQKNHTKDTAEMEDVVICLPPKNEKV